MMGHMSDMFEGQGYRSKVKVTKVKKCKNVGFQPSIRKYGPRSRSQGQGQSCLGSSPPPPATGGRCNTGGVFSLKETGKQEPFVLF